MEAVLKIIYKEEHCTKIDLFLLFQIRLMNEKQKFDLQKYDLGWYFLVCFAYVEESMELHFRR